MSTNSNISVVQDTMFVVINAAKSVVEKIIEAIIYPVCLTHDNSFSFSSRVAYLSNSVYLKKSFEYYKFQLK